VTGWPVAASVPSARRISSKNRLPSRPSVNWATPVFTRISLPVCASVSLNGNGSEGCGEFVTTSRYSCAAPADRLAGISTNTHCSGAFVSARPAFQRANG
jgi:hypothetical protein